MVSHLIILRLYAIHVNRFSRFGLFQVISAYTNTGMSLVDQSMVPFQKAYGMIIPLVFLIVAGNTGFVSGEHL
jgi:Trk-type K+ transport system membrane component